jgi:hypothetical protein
MPSLQTSPRGDARCGCHERLISVTGAVLLVLQLAYDCMPAVTAHRWDFKARFRRGAFGWRSQPAVARVREAVAEIRKVARRDPVLAADGAVEFLERVSPALERVDSSSGAIGNAVNNAIDELVGIIRDAPADPRIRDSWLDRLWAAHEDDQIPYIESLGDRWGELCASPEVASRWADELVSTTRMFLGGKKGQRGFFQGTTACLSALLTAGRYDEILDLLRNEDFWPYRRWAVKALAAIGRVEEALALAEASRGPWTNDLDLERICEEILVSAARRREAYERYGLSAGRRGTYAAWFRAVRDRYPDVPPRQVLADLVAATPGDEGKWFAATKDLGLYEEALVLASESPCDPKTLARAARDFEERRPEFALDAALLALEWLAKGYGYEVTGAEIWLAYSKAVSTAERLGRR